MAGAAPPATRAYLSIVEGHRKLYFNDRELAAPAVSLLFGQAPVKDDSVDGDTMVHCLSMRILEAASAHFQRDFKGLRDAILYLRKQVRAPNGACEAPGAAEFGPWFREAHDCLFM